MQCPVCGRKYNDEDEVDHIELYEMCINCDENSDEIDSTSEDY